MFWCACFTTLLQTGLVGYIVKENVRFELIKCFK
jgi:hypothetical protein